MANDESRPASSATAPADAAAGSSTGAGVASSPPSTSATTAATDSKKKEKKKEEEEEAEPLSPQDAALVYRYPQYPPDKYLISGAVPPPPFYVRRVGRMYVLRERIEADGSPKIVCVVGPCWPMIFVTLAIIVGVAMSVFLIFMPGQPAYVIVPPALLLVVVVASFLFTACRDPGIQKMHQERQDSSWTYNEQAQTYRAPGAIYDLEAQVVIKHIDHFCPWTGTIIARRNMKCFLLFTNSLCLLVLASILVVVAKLIIF